MLCPGLFILVESVYHLRYAYSGYMIACFSARYVVFQGRAKMTINVVIERSLHWKFLICWIKEKCQYGLYHFRTHFDATGIVFASKHVFSFFSFSKIRWPLVLFMKKDFGIVTTTRLILAFFMCSMLTDLLTYFYWIEKFSM